MTKHHFRSGSVVFIILISLGFFLAACTGVLPAPFDPSPSASPLPPTVTPSPTIWDTNTPSPTPILSIRFAVLGDYGLGGTAEADVAGLVHGWNPDLIITTGDNNYPDGAAERIDINIGFYYHDYIFPYKGSFGPGAELNRFFPVLGNHDWYTEGAQPYLDYFSLPGNERYYDFTWGPVHFFGLDSDEHEPDGFNLGSLQAAWLQQGLRASTSSWNIVYMHYPPYSSGWHGSNPVVQWPFAAWGADAILAGHDHLYERLEVDGIPYITNGAGGGGLYNFNDPLPESRFRYNANFGAMLVTANQSEINLAFYSRTGVAVDDITLSKP
jgi:tartrate-resistant acid phosphatase type 5